MKRLHEKIRGTFARLKAIFKRKYFLRGAVALFAVVLFSFVYVVIATHGNPRIVNDITELNPVHVVDIIVPHSIEEIVDAVKKNDHVSIGGGRNSMGGQTASEHAVQIDMREYNKDPQSFYDHEGDHRTGRH